MKGNFDADVLWPLDDLVQNRTVDRSTACNFTVLTFCLFFLMNIKSIASFELHSFGHFYRKKIQLYHNSFAHCEVSLHAWSDDHFNWNSLASIMIQEVCSSRLESFSSNNKQRIFLAPSWVFSAWHPQFLALLRNTWLLCSIFACNAARTTNAQWILFSSKSQISELGQTNWADTFLGLWGIFGRFNSIHFGTVNSRAHVFH